MLHCYQIRMLTWCCLAAACSYGFVVYMDPGVTDVACAGLNGMRMGERTLTVRRATEVNPRVLSAAQGWQPIRSEQLAACRRECSPAAMPHGNVMPGTMCWLSWHS